MKDMILGRNDDVRFAQLLAHQFRLTPPVSEGGPKGLAIDL